MSIKQSGGVFGRNPTFNDVTIDGTLTFNGDIDINSDLKVDGNIGTTGNVIIGTSGKGIDFSATAGTGTSELLDDYEEGTWTISAYDDLTAGNASATTGTGYYTKIGNIVHLRFSGFNNISTAGMTGGNTFFMSLPFSASGIGASAGSITLHTVTLSGGRTGTQASVSNGQGRMTIRQTGSNLSDSFVNVEDFDGTVSDIAFFAMSYSTA